MDIVFVHGLGGTSHGTWTKDGVLWPRDLLSKEKFSSRIMTWGYDADVMKFFGSPVSQANIQDHAQSLLWDLEHERLEDYQVDSPGLFLQRPQLTSPVSSTDHLRCPQSWRTNRQRRRSRNLPSRDVFADRNPFAPRRSSSPTELASETIPRTSTKQEQPSNFAQKEYSSPARLIVVLTLHSGRIWPLV